MSEVRENLNVESNCSIPCFVSEFLSNLSLSLEVLPESVNNINLGLHLAEDLINNVKTLSEQQKEVGISLFGHVHITNCTTPMSEQIERKRTENLILVLKLIVRPIVLNELHQIDERLKVIAGLHFNAPCRWLWKRGTSNKTDNFHTFRPDSGRDRQRRQDSDFFAWNPQLRCADQEQQKWQKNALVQSCQWYGPKHEQRDSVETFRRFPSNDQREHILASEAKTEHADNESQCSQCWADAQKIADHRNHANESNYAFASSECEEEQWMRQSNENRKERYIVAPMPFVLRET
jgi:hypothetical protein